MHENNIWLYTTEIFKRGTCVNAIFVNSLQRKIAERPVLLGTFPSRIWITFKFTDCRTSELFPLLGNLSLLIHQMHHYATAFSFLCLS